MIIDHHMLCYSDSNRCKSKWLMRLFLKKLYLVEDLDSKCQCLTIIWCEYDESIWKRPNIRWSYTISLSCLVLRLRQYGKCIFLTSCFYFRSNLIIFSLDFKITRFLIIYTKLDFVNQITINSSRVGHMVDRLQEAHWIIREKTVHDIPNLVWKS